MEGSTGDRARPYPGRTGSLRRGRLEWTDRGRRRRERGRALPRLLLLDEERDRRSHPVRRQGRRGDRHRFRPAGRVRRRRPCAPRAGGRPHLSACARRLGYRRRGLGSLRPWAKSADSARARREADVHEATSTSLNRLAFSATGHCLTGCAVGEVLGLVLATSFGWGNELSIAIAVFLAFLFGYAFTLAPLIRGGIALGVALPLALASDTLSIAVMEIVDNAVVLLWPGAMDAGLEDVVFWGSLAFGLAVAFAAAFPVNRALIARGRGHAVVHAHHTHGDV